MATVPNRPLRALVLIGTSTGGPKALTELFSHWKAVDGVACCVVQHMPPGFTANLANRLNQLSEWTVDEGVHGQPLVEKHVYIAPGGYQMRVTGSHSALQLAIAREDPVGGHQPSVDVLFDSAIPLASSLQLVGVILTGMGRDGVKGLGGIRDVGGYTVAESAESALIYGMPRVALESGAAMAGLPLSAISNWLTERLAL
ncbi:CheB methylesterase domain-containing protein [Alicyclobacillus acidiphilus]|uniref:CheB methylesterase domain-containing protein n=1 Tax=Alicyclobacillus acidiphilus TaxID=182455 RepID=UPI00082D274A|nr:CheB methylesterase domain-containing protein [Alicyclobacillus acidiphilus]